MENEDVIREQMKDTRTALTEKLEKLENKVVSTVSDTTQAVTETVEAVKDTVQGTTDAVTETVEKVKETVQDTVESVTDTVKGGVRSVANLFNPREHPWVCMGASVLSGFLAGKLLTPRREPMVRDMAAAAEAAYGNPPRGNGHATGSHSAIAAGMTAAGQGRSHGGSRNGGPRDRDRKPESKGWLQGIAEQLGPEVEKVKALSLGMLLDASRDMLMRMVPQQWKGHVGGIFQGLAQKLHAEPAPADQETQQQGYTHEEERHDDERGRKHDMERSGNRGSKRHKFDR